MLLEVVGDRGFGLHPQPGAGVAGIAAALLEHRSLEHTDARATLLGGDGRR